MSNKPRRPAFVQLLITPLLLTGFAVALIFSNWLWPADRFVYDLQLWLRSTSVPEDIVIVEIDNESLGRLGRWPWPRSVHARLLDRLREARARVVGLDILFAEPDAASPGEDTALAQAIERHGRVVLPLAIEALQTHRQLVEVLPFPLLAGAAAGLGHVNTEIDPDGIVRGVYLRQGLGSPFWFAFSLEMVKLSDPAADLDLPGRPAVASAQPQASPRTVVSANHILIPFDGPPGRFLRTSYIDVLDNTVDPAGFADKFVFVGITAPGLGDAIPTATGSGYLMPGVEIHATILAGLRNGRSIIPIAQSLHVALTALFVFLPVLWLPRVLPYMAVTVIGLAATGVLVLSTLLLLAVDIWFPPSAAMLALLIAYPLWSWRRLAFTMGFLHQSLDRLNREPVLEKPAPSLVYIRRTMDFWGKILPVAGYVVQSPDGTRHAGHGINPTRPSSLAGHWHHSGQTSWLMLNPGDGPIEIGINWSERLDNSRLAPLLTSLQRAQRSAAPEGARSTHELIEERSLQVQEATDRLRLMRRFIGDCLAQMSDGVVVADGTGRILISNRRMQALVPEILDQSAGDHSLLALLSRLKSGAPCAWPDLLRSVLLEGRSAVAEAQTDDGHELLVKLAGLNLGDEVGPGVIVNLTDISSLKDEERRRAETLHFLSHDLRSPMVSLLALIESAGARPGAATDRALLDRIAGYARNNLEFAEQFLQLARAESAEEIEFYELDMEEVAENAADQVRVFAARKQIRIETAVSPETDTWLEGNGELLERVLVNLLTNAVKYSPPETTVTVHLGNAGDTLRCCVQDQGYGLPEEAIPMLFERFSRFHQQTAKNERGAGLGLRFVKTVVDRHGATITVRSKPGAGSEFCLSLPRRR